MKNEKKRWGMSWPQIFVVALLFLGGIALIWINRGQHDQDVVVEKPQGEIAITRFTGEKRELSFSRDVRPILSDKCVSCHGPDKEARKADLRLDIEEEAKRNLGGYAAIVSGKPDKSEVVSRIETGDEDDIMPPIDSHLSLSEEEKLTIRRWIVEGAKWEKHWSYVGIPDEFEVPQGKNGVDFFVEKKFMEHKLKPVGEADKVTWLRRVTQDLTGLPPRLEEVDAFLKDDTSGAYEKVVRRLLAGDAYAEQMTSIWLDNARYADSNGFQFDNARTMWPWRDWVLKAFKKNIPYDRFVRDQLAGDLLDNPTQEQLIATGFNRNHGYSIEGGIIDEEYRVMYANDKTATFGTLFLGLTLDCARCHDHKYDELGIKEYYSLYAFFNSSSEKGAPGAAGRHKKAAAPYVEYIGDDGQKALAMVMKEKSRVTRLLKEGLFDQPGEVVKPNTPAVLPSFAGYAPNRLGLANWLASKENPLFARVTVNRMWQQFFGVGLVKTSDNFGAQGALPSHPELLDWLAGEFRNSGWDLQHVIHLIVLSDTYRRSSDGFPDKMDPENIFLTKGASFRLSAEQIRDQTLVASGLLTNKMGGPSVMPHQPKGVWEDLNAPPSHREIYKQGKGGALHRRSLYTYWRRSVLHPAMSTFDAPSRDVCSVQRISTNTPLQALVTMHDPAIVEAALALAVVTISKQSPLQDAFRRVLSRFPTPSELATLRGLHEKRLKHYGVNMSEAKHLVSIGEVNIGDAEVSSLAALTDVCHVLFNLSETITRK